MKKTEKMVVHILRMCTNEDLRIPGGQRNVHVEVSGKLKDTKT